MSDLKTRLKEAINLRQYKPKALSLQAGLNETAIRDILKGRSKNPRTDTTRKIANILNIRHEWLVDGFPPMENTVATNTNRHTAQEPSQDFITTANHMISLYSLSSTDSFEISCYKYNTEIKHIERPPYLTPAIDVFACHCPDNKMAPKFSKGDILYLQQTQNFKEDTDSLIRLVNDEVIIATLTQHSHDQVKLSYHSNEKSLIINSQDIKKNYEIVSILYQSKINKINA